MAKGIYFECDFCKTLTFKELYEGSQESSVYEEFKKLPNGWVEMDAPYCAPEEFICGTYSEKVHVCSVKCAIAYLKETKKKMDRYEELMKADGANENTEEV